MIIFSFINRRYFGCPQLQAERIIDLNPSISRSQLRSSNENITHVLFRRFFRIFCSSVSFECHKIFNKMNRIIVVRCHRPGDEMNCREMIKQGVMSSVNTAFLANLFKEVTFQFMILGAAIMFIFFGMPFTICLLIVPMVIFMTYVSTYLAFTAKSVEINQEISNVSRIYMSNAFSRFWVAEAFEPYLTNKHPKDIRYTLMTESQFRKSDIDVSSHLKKIVGSIGLSKSHRLDKGAWIKRLCVDERYRRKGIASLLLNVAVQFAIDEGYSCANTVASEYTDGGRELCLKKGFELKQMYHKPVLGPVLTVLMYELTYQIKAGNDYCEQPAQVFKFN